MELQQLKYFKSVAQIGKISDAAESLFVSPPALSTSISRLEKELGFNLFDRTGNRITLNTQGQIFLKYVNQVFSALADAQQELQESMRQQQDHVSVFSTNSVVWIDLLAAYTSEFPDQVLSCSNISPSRLDASFHGGFLLSYENELPHGFGEEADNIYLFQTHPTVMLHKDHPLAKHTQVNVSMLVGEKMFMPHPGGMLHNRILQLFELQGLPTPVENNFSYLMRQKMVSENIGISFSTHQCSFIPTKDVCYIPLADPFEPWTARMYWHKKHTLSEAEQNFLTFTESFYKGQH